MLVNDKSEFTQLFNEFITSYPYTPNGISHIKSYTEQRQQACRNFEIIRTAADRGENIRELVLLQLLPHSNTINNRQRGAWIHIAPHLSPKILKNGLKVQSGLKVKIGIKLLLLFLILYVRVMINQRNY